MNAPNLIPAITPQEQIQRITGAVQEVWAIPASQQSALSIEVGKASMKHGLVAQVPLVCKGGKCPYIDTCQIPEADRVDGSRCIAEIATLVTRFEKYCAEFNVQETDTVDLGQIKHLVDIEIKLFRCNQSIAANPEMVDEIVTAVQRGQKYTKKELNPVTQYELQLFAQHSKILKDLAATRDAKKLSSGRESSKQAADLIARAAK